MLRFRLLYGTLMFAALAGVLAMDVQLEAAGPRTPGLVILVVFAVLVALGGRELCAIFGARGIEASALPMGVGGVAGLSFMYAAPLLSNAGIAAAGIGSIAAGLFVAALVTHSYPRKRVEGAAGAGAAALVGLTYLGLLPGFYLAARWSCSAWMLATVIAVTKLGDSGAYFTGRMIGRHKLIPWLSPKKTWEGLAGAVVVAAVAAVILVAVLDACGGTGSWRGPIGSSARTWVASSYPLWGVATAGALLGLVGHLGDLVASLLKRDAGFKDSGQSIPGFGGVLDVLDSPIMAAPVAYWILELAARA
jgi:phosphatidate cytidylyltransferase